MPEVGQALREARTDRGIELTEVERVTKIRIKYLRAMEDECWDLLPGEAYARGFLSTYAQFLGLDERALLAEFRSEHEPAAEQEPLPEAMLPQPGTTGRPRPRPALVAGGAVIIAVAIALVVALPGGSDDADSEGARPAAGGEPARAGSPDGGDESRDERIGSSKTVSVDLRSTGPVWVCLLDDRGRELIDGETLASGEDRGPFEGRELSLGLGNGSIEVTVDGEAVDIPSSPDPLGYRISRDGASELAAPERPTCL